MVRVGNRTEPQPAAVVLRLRRISNKQVAEATGFCGAWVGRVLNGYSKPSRKFRMGVARFLELPESELFRTDGEPQ